MMPTVCNEMFKMLQAKFNNGTALTSGSANFAGMHDSSHALTYAPTHYQHISKWIIDTGVSDHMTPFNHLFIHSRTLKRPVLITLPDGSTKSISVVGKIKLTLALTLHYVLFVPDFKYNLLSVGKLLNTQKLIAHFFIDHWEI